MLDVLRNAVSVVSFAKMFRLRFSIPVSFVLSCCRISPLPLDLGGKRNKCDQFRYVQMFNKFDCLFGPVFGCPLCLELDPRSQYAPTVESRNNGPDGGHNSSGKSHNTGIWLSPLIFFCSFYIGISSFLQ